MLELAVPKVMGIVNCTPDSFFSKHGTIDEDPLPDIIDIGAFSTRPGHGYVSIDEERERLQIWFRDKGSRQSITALPLSIDTFRADIARMCVEEYGVSIINDVSGGSDPDMFATAAELSVPYVLTLSTPFHTPEGAFDTVSAIRHLAIQIEKLHELGVRDIIVDPGFGFGKSLDDNFKVAAELERFKLLQQPILAGISRKSMISNLLGCSTDEALNGTTVLNTLLLAKGASILRVHDVKEARECIRLTEKMGFYQGGRSNYGL